MQPWVMCYERSRTAGEGLGPRKPRNGAKGLAVDPKGFGKPLGSGFSAANGLSGISTIMAGSKDVTWETFQCRERLEWDFYLRRCRLTVARIGSLLSFSAANGLSGISTYSFRDESVLPGVIVSVPRTA